MRIAPQGELCEIGAHVNCSILTELPGSHEPSQRVDDFDIDQVGGMEVAVLGEPRDERLVARTCEQARQDRGGVNDDHARSRPARTAPTEGPPALASARARTSAIGGRSATRVISAWRYSESDQPCGCRPRAQCAMDRIRHVANLNRSRHADMYTCYACQSC